MTSFRSVGFYTHLVAPSGDVRLVRGSVGNLDTPEFMNFFETMSNSVVPSAKGGHVDMFAPIASTGKATDMFSSSNVFE